jgi:hypothetical protein
MVEPKEEKARRRFVLKGVRILHGGPTSGKSTLIKKLVKEDPLLAVFDTDDLYRHFFMKWWDYKGWRHTKTDKMADLADKGIQSAVAMMVNQLLLSGVFHLCIGNLWGTEFLSFLDPSLLVGGKVPVSFFVDPECAVKRAVARGGSGFGLKLTTRWYAGWKEHGDAAFGKMITLGEGEFMSDIVQYERRPVQAECRLSPALAGFALNSEGKHSDTVSPDSVADTIENQDGKVGEDVP